MSKTIERKQEDVIRTKSDDDGDRVTAETDIENYFSSAVTRDSDSVETEKENVCDGDSTDAMVTAESRCETSCQPVTHSGSGKG